MADLQKFLDQSGVSTLWSRIAEEVAKVDEKAIANNAAIEGHETRLTVAESKIASLEAGTYDDSELRTLIGANTSAIEILNGDGEGSVAATAEAKAALEVAKIVAGADASFDTLKEIADWISNDTTGAASMANDIDALESLVGDKAVATQIAEAIDAAGLDKYALAADLTGLAERVAALENVEPVQIEALTEEEIDAAIAAATQA